LGHAGILDRDSSFTATDRREDVFPRNWHLTAVQPATVVASAIKVLSFSKALFIEAGVKKFIALQS